MGKKELYCSEHKDHRKNRVCPECGKPTMSRSGNCRKCMLRAIKAEGNNFILSTDQIRADKRVLTEHDRPFVEKWWAEGLSCIEISRRLGLSAKNPKSTIVGRRRTGWNLPLRNEGASKRMKGATRGKDGRVVKI